MGTGTEDGEAEAVVPSDQCGSGAVGSLLGVRWDDAIAIDDDVLAGNDGGDGVLLRVGMGRKAYA
jgi:hypothetical protein